MNRRGAANSQGMADGVRRLLRLVTALLVVAVAPASWATAQGVSGAGSSLAFPLLSRWSQAYQRVQSDAEFQPVGTGLDFEPSGSQAGIMRLREGAVDFGATDAPLSTEELARFSLGQFPIVIGGIVVAVNLNGVEPGQLRLTGELIADIYLGSVRNWSDPGIRALNPDLPLPDAPIAVLRRSDGSGTTFNFTDYLSKLSPRWRAEIGRGLRVAWPAGTGARGNDGMAETLRRTPYAIGYVDFAQARAARLSHALLRNRAGAFISPGVDTFKAAAEGADGDPVDGSLLTDASGAASYPIVATTYAVLPRQAATLARSRAAIAFFRWSLDHGASAATELGYVALPPGMVGRVNSYWASNF